MRVYECLGRYFAVKLYFVVRIRLFPSLVQKKPVSIAETGFFYFKQNRYLQASIWLKLPAASIPSYSTGESHRPSAVATFSAIYKDREIALPVAVEQHHVGR